MCNLYSITTNQAAITALFRVVNRYVGNLAPMPGVFPDYKAPIVRTGVDGRELVTARWGMPSSSKEAFARVAQTYLALISERPSVGDSQRQFLASEAQTAVAVLIRQFPTSYFSAQALDALKAAGLGLVENPRSWISKTSK
jgi:putative SOS response-associated peptidase YedK